MRMLRITALLIVGVGGVVAVAVWTTDVRSRDTISNIADASRRERMAPLPMVTAEELNARYMKNEVAADAAFRDHRFVLQGVVSEIGKTASDKPFIWLKVPGTLLGVHADVRTDHMNALASLSPDETVYLDCRGAMMLLHVASVVDCVPMPAPVTMPVSLSFEQRSESPYDDLRWTLTVLPTRSQQTRHIEVDFVGVVGQSAHNGTLTDTIAFTNGHGRVERGACVLNLDVYADSLRVSARPGSDGPVCDFGLNVYAAGLYYKRLPK